MLIAFSVFLFWCVGASYLLGYDMSPEDINRTVWGIPRWVFWGVALPWMLANVFTFWFAWFFVADDPLGDELVEPNRPTDQDQAEGER